MGRSTFFVKKYSDEQRAEIRKLMKTMTNGQVAEIMDMPLSTVKGFRNRWGLPNVGRAPVRSPNLRENFTSIQVQRTWDQHLEVNNLLKGWPRGLA